MAPEGASHEETVSRNERGGPSALSRTERRQSPQPHSTLSSSAKLAPASHPAARVSFSSCPHEDDERQPPDVATKHKLLQSRVGQADMDMSPMHQTARHRSVRAGGWAPQVFHVSRKVGWDVGRWRPPCVTGRFGLHSDRTVGFS